jgi:ribosome-binding protein aMBF1 (putative translation factor)
MKAKRIIRANGKSNRERERERALRERLQAEKPSLDDLIRSRDADPDAVMTMEMYFDIQAALQALKQERTKRGLSIGEVADRSGLDRAVISRLENGKQDNPTVATLMRYAAAIGKRFLWTFENSESNSRRAAVSGTRRNA